MALRVLVAMAVRVGAMAELVEISNKEPRLDVAGNIMDCHDGNILHIGGAYWNFCMEYGSCPGRPRISACWRGPTLWQWTPVVHVYFRTFRTPNRICRRSSIHCKSII